MRFLALVLSAAAATALAAQAPVPYLVRDLTPQRHPVDAGVFFSAHTVGDIFYFGTDYPAAGLWRTDGTATGTYRVADDAPGWRSFQWQRLLEWRGKLLYPADTSEGMFLYRTDGTTPGTERIAEVPFRVHEMAPCPGEKFCFVTNGHYVGVSDGTAAGTSIIASTAPGAPETNLPRYLTAFQGKVWFNAYDNEAGQCISYRGHFLMCGELWVSDGTQAGTRRFADLVPGPLPSSPTGLLANGDHLYFYTYEPAGDYCQLWVSDGTIEGTHAFKPEVATDCAAIHPALVPFRGYTYVNSFELGVLRTDGTFGGTQRLADMLGWTGVTSMRLYPAGDEMLLLVQRTESYEVWSFDGERATKLGDAPRPETMLGYLPKTRRFYHVLEQKVPRELWSFDGRTHERVFQFPPHTGGATIYPWGKTPGFLAFAIAGQQRWVTDGTEAGTRPLDLSNSVSESSYPETFLAAQGKLFFRTSGTTAMRLWATDGTAAGTVALSPDGSLFSRGGRVYFNGSSGGLWTTDGTAAGTQQVARVLGVDTPIVQPPAYLGSSAVFVRGEELARRDGNGTVTGLGMTGRFYGFETIGDAAIFWADAPGGGAASLYATDGTAEGTRPLVAGLDVVSPDFLVVDGAHAFFVAKRNGADETWLFRTDGTPAGTKEVAQVASGPNVAFEPKLAWRGAACFVIRTGAQFVLWRSDGTAEGSYVLTDRFLRSMAAVGEELVLVLGTPTGSEIWRSDGTVAGTVRVRAVDWTRVSAPFALPDGSAAVAGIPGGAWEQPRRIEIYDVSRGTLTVVPTGALRLGSSVSSFVHSGGKLYFVASRAQTGFELWAVPLDGGARPAAESEIGIAYRGVARVNGGRAAVFRVTMEADGATEPTVVAATVAGSLREGEDYTPFSRRIRFENDHPVTLVVPLHGDAAGTVSVVLTSPADARVVHGFATAYVGAPGRRRLVRP